MTSMTIILNNPVHRLLCGTRVASKGNVNVPPKDWLILADIPGVIHQNTGQYIAIAEATPNFG